ncbi:ANKRD26, partial [Cervus elaphus hippelaphus]
MLHLQDQMLLDVAKLESNSEMFSQQLDKVESKFNKLNIKLHQKRVDLREKTLMLECVQRDLGQTECQKQETELMYHNEQGKVNEYLRKPESLEERLSLLQSENMLLRQQLDDAQNKANSQEKTVISIQDQLLQIMKKLHAENDKQRLMLEERNKELINKQNHLKERMCQYENEKAEEEAVVRQLRQEVTDALKKQPMSEASLQVMSHYRANLEAEAQDFKRKLHQLPSQTDHLPAELETACSQCWLLHAKNQFLQQELSMKGRQKKCEKLEKEKKKLEQEVVKLKSHVEMNMIEHTQVEQYKRKIEERMRQGLVEKLKEINPIL